MATPHFISSFKRRWLAYRKRRFAGFTLIELLVSIIIGAIITVALLSFVIELTDNNQKDSARSETQREMQAALDYMAQDLREAVFVYDGACLEGRGSITDANLYASSCPGVVNHIPTAIGQSADTLPVLAFWRTDPLPEGLEQACRNADLKESPIPDGIKNVRCIAGKTYTLVVYALKKNPVNDPIWKGKARLLRYQLSQFSAQATDNTETTGYVDPLPQPNSEFQQWPYQLLNGGVVLAQTSLPTDTAAELVDFVDDTAVGDNPPTCPDPNNPDPSTQRISLTPPDTLLSGRLSIRSFYACVRGQVYNPPSTPPKPSPAVNQEVLLTLTGNVSGRSGFPSTTPTNEARLFPIQTRVLSRGIIDKSPTQ